MAEKERARKKERCEVMRTYLDCGSGHAFGLKAQELDAKLRQDGLNAVSERSRCTQCSAVIGLQWLS